MLVSRASLEGGGATWMHAADVEHREPLLNEWKRAEPLHVDFGRAHDASLEPDDTLPAVQG